MPNLLCLRLFHEKGGETITPGEKEPPMKINAKYVVFSEKSRCIAQWATRSYAIALVFIGGRFVLGVTGWEVLGMEIAQAIIWSCLALSVVLADVSIHWKEIRAALST